MHFPKETICCPPKADCSCGPPAGLRHCSNNLRTLSSDVMQQCHHGIVTREAIGSESYWYPKNAARDQMPHEFQEMSTLRRLPFKSKNHPLCKAWRTGKKETQKPSEILEWKNNKITFNMNSAKNYETPWTDMKGA
jgi:hypothetical protein